MKELTKRDWFQNAHAHIAGVIAGCMMQGKVTSNTPGEITRQLKRAYNQGVRDAKMGKV